MNEISFVGQLLKLLLGLAAVVGMLLLMGRILHTRGGTAMVGRASFRVIATLPVGQRERLLVVQLGQRQLLVGVASGAVRLLQELPEPLDVGPADSRPGVPLSGWLGRFGSGKQK